MDVEEEAPLKSQPAQDQLVPGENSHLEGHPGGGEAGEVPEYTAPATATDVALEQDA